jgi:WD repeat-containing protein 45
MALHLPAHTLADEARSPILGVSFNSSGSSSFATATTEGWVVYRTEPLEVLSRRGRQQRRVILQSPANAHSL